MTKPSKSDVLYIGLIAAWVVIMVLNMVNIHNRFNDIEQLFAEN